MTKNWFLFDPPFHSASFVFVFLISQIFSFNFLLGQSQDTFHEAQTHRHKQVAKGGDDASAETHDK